MPQFTFVHPTARAVTVTAKDSDAAWEKLKKTHEYYYNRDYKWKPKTYTHKRLPDGSFDIPSHTEVRDGVPAEIRKRMEGKGEPEKVNVLVESLLKEEFDPISHHITGNYPLREIGPEDFEDYPLAWIVHFPRGFETFQIAVHGDSLEEQDAIEAAWEWASENIPNSLNGDPGEEEDLYAVKP